MLSCLLHRDADHLHPLQCPFLRKLTDSTAQIADEELELCRHLIATITKLRHEPMSSTGYDMRLLESHSAELFGPTEPTDAPEDKGMPPQAHSRPQCAFFISKRTRRFLPFLI